jgi:hypothetical protein
MIILCIQMIIAGKTEVATDQNAKQLTTGIFQTLGVATGKKLNKEQFVEG